MRDHLAIGEGIVDGAGHGLVIVFSFVAGARCAGKFSIGQGKLILMDGLLHDT